MVERARVRYFLIIIILATLPCYCAGLVYVWVKPHWLGSTQTPSPTSLETAQQTQTRLPTLIFPSPILPRTFTPTDYPTIRSSPTLTPTDFQTPTPTKTLTPTLTFSPTASYTPSLTSTMTITLTVTATSTLTSTPSETSTMSLPPPP